MCIRDSDWAVETSIYVDQNKKRMGIGKKLHEALEEDLRNRGFLNMNACIAYPCLLYTSNVVGVSKSFDPNLPQRPSSRP